MYNVHACICSFPLHIVILNTFVLLARNGEAYPINCLYKDYLLCFITCTFYVISTMFFLHFFTSVLDNIRYQIYSGRERYTCSQICAQNQVNHFRENPISQWWLNTLSVFSVFIFSVLYVPLVWNDKWLLAIFFADIKWMYIHVHYNSLLG